MIPPANVSTLTSTNSFWGSMWSPGADGHILTSYGVFSASWHFAWFLNNPVNCPFNGKVFFHISIKCLLCNRTRICRIVGKRTSFTCILIYPSVNVIVAFYAFRTETLVSVVYDSEDAPFFNFDIIKILNILRMRSQPLFELLVLGLRLTVQLR
jgi:hypothetical protein